MKLLPFVTGALLAIALVACGTSESEPSSGTNASSVVVSCAGVRQWVIGGRYQVREVVVFEGKSYRALIAHTAFAPDWNPAMSTGLWMMIGTCADSPSPPVPPPNPGPPLPQPSSPPPPP